MFISFSEYIQLRLDFFININNIYEDNLKHENNITASTCYITDLILTRVDPKIKNIGFFNSTENSLTVSTFFLNSILFNSVFSLKIFIFFLSKNYKI